MAQTKHKVADTYIARDGEMLDWISWRYYGSEMNTVAILEFNPDLAGMGAVLSAGTIVYLPDMKTPPKRIDVVRLWD